MKKTCSIKCWQEYGANRTFLHRGESSDWCNHFSKLVLSIKAKLTQKLYDSVILFIEIQYQKWYKCTSKDLYYYLQIAILFMASLVAQRLKHLPPMRETQVPSLGQEDPPEKEMATHFSILAWRIPWTEEPGRLQSTGSQTVGHDWATSLSHTIHGCIICNCQTLEMIQVSINSRMDFGIVIWYCAIMRMSKLKLHVTESHKHNVNSNNKKRYYMTPFV